ncbi:MAG TPA: hypothetical protein VMH39_04825, partial [Gemmatimonadaceae bacterium]|nr:hypothetical protein [Gemmatimonadaceae bacterium]
MKARVVRSSVALAAVAAAVLSTPVLAQGGGRGRPPAPTPPPGPGSIEEVAPPGDNYEIAEFRFWAPPGETA